MSTIIPPLPSWAVQEQIQRHRLQLEGARELKRREKATQGLESFIRFVEPRYDFGWVHQEMCALFDDFLRAVELGASPRVVVSLPPGSGKSWTLSKLAPVYTLAKHPEWEWISATYGQGLADEFGRDVRTYIEDLEVKKLFPDFAVREDADARADWMTTQKGKYRAVGIGGPTTGKRAHVFVVDDPIKDMQDADSPAKQKEAWDWFNAVANTRLHPGGGVFIVQTFWSMMDIGMRVQEKTEVDGAERYVVYKFPMVAEQDEKHRKQGETIHPARFSTEWADRTKATFYARQQSRVWHSLYQCNPVPDEGTYFKRDDVARTYTVTPQHGEVFVALDAAVKDKEQNDDQAIGAWSHTTDGTLILLPGAFIGHCDTFLLLGHIFRLMKHYNGRMLAAGRDHIVGSLGPFLREEMRKQNLYFTIEELPETGDKMRKNRSAQARSQAHQLLFPEGDLFRGKILPQLLLFPAGKHDDAVDMVGNACRAAEAFFPPSIPPPPPTVSAADTPGTGAWLQAQFEKQSRRGAPAGVHRPSLVPGK